MVSDDVVDELLMYIVSLEQRGIYALIAEGIEFKRLGLYRRNDYMEQGILVDGKIACSITLKYSCVKHYRGHTPTAVIEMLFYPPFDYLN